MKIKRTRYRPIAIVVWCLLWGIPTHIMTMRWIAQHEANAAVKSRSKARSRKSTTLISVPQAVSTCYLDISNLSCSYNPNTDQCYYNLIVDCKSGVITAPCQNSYVVSLWKSTFTGWQVAFQRCYPLVMSCGDFEPITSGLAPLYGPGDYWFQVDVYYGNCGAQTAKIRSSYWTFSRN